MKTFTKLALIVSLASNVVLADNSTISVDDTHSEAANTQH